MDESLNYARFSVKKAYFTRTLCHLGLHGFEITTGNGVISFFELTQPCVKHAITMIFTS
jgi:hypothetical protein